MSRLISALLLLTALVAMAVPAAAAIRHGYGNVGVQSILPEYD